MSLRFGLLATLIVCGCNSDGLVIVEDGGAPTDRFFGPGWDVAIPDIAELAMPDLAISDLATGPQMWIRQFGTARPEEAYGVATDGNGSIYVTGYTWGELDGNTRAGNTDAFLVKYDANGNKLWTRQFGSTAGDAAHGVAIDGAGNVYVTGVTSGGLDGNQVGGFEDAFLVKYSRDGKKLWTRQFGGAGNDGGIGVATDGMGKVYVTGWGDPADLGGVFLAKYDANGNELWTRVFGSGVTDFAWGIATDRMGNAYVTGVTQRGLDGKPTAGLSDAFLVKYDMNGKGLWTRQFGTARDDEGRGAATDAAGNVYMTGYTEGGLDGNQNAGEYDAFLVKYDANGNKLWTRQFGSAAGDAADGVAIDSAGNAHVTGGTQGALDGNQNVGNGDAFLVKFDADGKKLWTRQFGTALNDRGTGVASDGAGNSFVTGYTEGGLDGNQNAGVWDVFLARFPAEP